MDPILAMLVFYVVFGILFDRGGEGFVAFLLTGLVVWNWYNQTLAHAGNTIVIGNGLMNQVHVPKLVFPIVTLLTDLTKFAVVLGVLILFLWASGYSVGWSYLALPVVILTQLLLCMALAFMLAAMVPFLPDLKLFVDNLLNLQFFLSGIFFGATDIPEQYRFWFYLNPMASLIEDYRAIFLYSAWPHWERLGAIGAISLVVLIFMSLLIRRLDHVYPRLAR